MTKLKSTLSKLTVAVMSATMVFHVSAAAACPFKDVAADKWYYDDVMRAFTEKIMTGTDFDAFEPNAPMTREMFVTALKRMGMVSTFYVGKSLPFKDVKTGSWYNDSVAWAAGLGVTNGKSDDTFGTGEPVTREQIATFLYRYLNNSIIAAKLTDAQTPEKPFSDTPSEYAREAVELMRKTGIIKGDDGKFNPQQNATRAEVAAMLVRLADALKSAEYRFNVDPDNVSKLEVRWQVRGEDDKIPKTKAITDLSDLKRAAEYLNKAAITNVSAKDPADGWLYDVRFYDKSGECSYGYAVTDNHVDFNDYIYETAAFVPFIAWIKA